MFKRFFILLCLIVSLPAQSIAQERLIISDVSSAKADKKQQEHQAAALGGNLSELSRAAVRGKLEKLFKLIDLGAKVDEVDSAGNTALKRAVQANKIASVQVLLDGGANVNLRDKEGLTPLVYAVRQKSVAMVSLLLTKGADANIKDELGATPLIFAAQEGDLAILQELLNGGAYVDAVDKNGLSALMYASLSDDIATASVLLTQGADPNKLTPAGKTAKSLVKPQGKMAKLSLLGTIEEQKAALIDPVQKTKSSEPTPAVKRGPKLTRLRSRGRPEGVFQFGKKGMRLKSAQVEIRNAGSVEATDVVVYIVAPGGKRIKANGPKNLAKYSKAIYLTGSIDELVTRQGRLKTDIRCTNCR